MQNVERRPAKPGRWKWLLPLALLAIALAGAAFLVLRPAKRQTPNLESSELGQVVLISVDAGNIASFSARPTYGEPYSFIRQADSFVPKDNTAFVLDQHRLEVIEGSLAHIETMDDFGPLVLMDNETLEDFGLGQEAFILEVTYTDGSSIRLQIGHRLHGELPLEYLMVDGSPNLYAISADIRDTFDRPLNTLHMVPPINFTPALLDRLTVTGDYPLTLQHLEHDLWMLEEPFPYPADKQAVQQLLKNVGDMRLAAFVAQATAANLSKYGFSPATASIQFDLKPSTITSLDNAGKVAELQQVPAQTLALSFGDAASEFGWYCLYDDAIYQVSDLSMGFLMHEDWRSLASPTPIDTPLSVVTSLKVTAGDEVQTYEISLTERVLPNNELLRDEEGDLLYDFVIRRDGLEVDPLTITNAYAKLMDLRMLGNLPDGYEPKGSALLTLEIITPRYRRTIAFYRYDALHTAVSVNGTFLHYVDKAVLEGVNFFEN